MSRQRIQRVLDLSKAKRISDLSLSKALDAVQALRDAGLSQHQSLHPSGQRFLPVALEGWSSAGAPPCSPGDDERRIGPPARSATLTQEAARVVQAANRTRIRDLTGPDRAMLYALALGPDSGRRNCEP